MPWDRERIQPADLDALYDGWYWRRSRDLEALAQVVLWLRSMMDSETDFEKIVASMPGYDQAYSKQIEDMKTKALKKMKKKGKRG